MIMEILIQLKGYMVISRMGWGGEESVFYYCFHEELVF